ncbi:MAG: DnaD domain protein [Acutalibacteraceae bacterium]
MEYTLNSSIKNLGFVVPCEIVDKELRYLKGPHLKVLLWALRNPSKNINCKILAYDLGITCQEVESAVKFLENKNLISLNKNSDSNNLLSQEKLNATESGQAYKPELKYQRPNANYIARRIENSNEINFLMQEAEIILGRPLSTGDSAILIMLHDNEGLPIDVIFMILQYSMSIGKVGMKYIEKLGSSWAKEGIDSIEKAENKIKALDVANLNWKKFENIIGIEHRAPTARESDTIMRWFDEWNVSEDLIKEAYERCVNANGKYVLNYMDSIIKRWRNEKIFTIEQALMENSAKKRYKSAAKPSGDASYNIDEYENYSIFDHVN